MSKGIPIKHPMDAYLYSMVQIRKEMCIVYNEARQGKIPMADASKLFFMLNIIVKGAEVGNRLWAEDRQITYENPDFEQANAFTRYDP